MRVKKRQSDSDSTWNALSFAWELGYSIVIPLVVMLLGGIYFDKRFETSPRFTLIGVGLSFIVTCILLVTRVRKVLKEFEQPSTQQQPPDQTTPNNHNTKS